MNLFEAAFVIARRDFVATVYSRSFFLFLIAPIAIMGVSLLFGQLAGRAERDASQPTVAVTTDRATLGALNAARTYLVSTMSERSLPRLRAVEPEEDVRAQARILVADQEGGLSAVFSGTLDQPVLSGPERIDEFVAGRMALIVGQAQRDAALAERGGFTPVQMERDITPEAAGNLREIRRGVAQAGQGLIFFVSLLLVTMLLSTLVEEKSNKIIEVLAAAVPLDAIFLGKLIAMLGISLVGLALWGSVIGFAGLLSVNLLPAGFELPDIAPAIGWPIYLILLLLYYATNYLLLGSLFLGIGSQASNIREIQSLSMPVSMLQLGVFFLAFYGTSAGDGWLAWTAMVVPFSSPLAMIGFAGQSELLWPHLLALAWQAFWVVIIVRLSAGLFRKTVMKSGGKIELFPRLRPRRS